MEQKAWNKKHGTKSMEQRAKGKGQGAKGREGGFKRIVAVDI